MEKSTRQEFDAKLERPEGTGTWTYFTVPFSVEKVFGGKAQVKVRGTMNGIPFRSSVMPGGDGTHYMVANKALRDKAGVSCGDIVRVVMEPDTEERVADIPEDFKNALLSNENARAHFDQMSFSHKKEYLDWINEAKKAETRASRIEKAVTKLQEGTRLK